MKIYNGVYINNLTLDLNCRQSSFCPKKLYERVTSPKFYELLNKYNGSTMNVKPDNCLEKVGNPFVKLQRNIAKLFRSFPHGLPLEKLSSEYQKYFGEALEPKEYGCHDVIDLIIALKDILKTENDRSSLIVHSLENAKQSRISPIGSSSSRDLRNIVKIFNYIINSFNGKVTIEQLIKQYEIVTKETLNISQLGYGSVFEMISDMRGELELSSLDGNKCTVNDETNASVSSEKSSDQILFDEHRSADVEVNTCFKILRQNICKILGEFPEGLSIDELLGVYYGYFGVNNTELSPELYGFSDLETLIRKSNLFSVRREHGKIIVSSKSFFGESTAMTFEASRIVGFGEIYKSLDIQKMAAKANGFNIVLGDIYSPDKFWIIKSDANHLIALENLMDRINAFYWSDIGLRYVISKPNMIINGQPIIVYDEEDKMFYRSIFIAYEELTSAKVYYIDYGKTVCVPQKNLRFIHEEFFHLPAQGMKCKLYGIRPITGTSWPKNTTKHFIDLVHNRVLVAFPNILGDNGVLEISLVDKSEGANIDIICDLVRKEMAAFKDIPGDPIIEKMKCNLLEKDNFSISADANEKPGKRFLRRPKNNYPELSKPKMIPESSRFLRKPLSVSKNTDDNNSDLHQRFADREETDFISRSSESNIPELNSKMSSCAIDVAGSFVGSKSGVDAKESLGNYSNLNSEPVTRDQNSHSDNLFEERQRQSNYVNESANSIVCCVDDNSSVSGLTDSPSIRTIKLKSGVVVHVVTVNNIFYLPMREMNLLMDKKIFQEIIMERSLISNIQVINEDDHPLICKYLIRNGVYNISNTVKSDREVDLVPIAEVCKICVSKNAEGLSDFIEFMSCAFSESESERNVSQRSESSSSQNESCPAPKLNFIKNVNDKTSTVTNDSLLNVSSKDINYKLEKSGNQDKIKNNEYVFPVEKLENMQVIARRYVNSLSNSISNISELLTDNNSNYAIDLVKTGNDLRLQMRDYLEKCQHILHLNANKTSNQARPVPDITSNNSVNTPTSLKQIDSVGIHRIEKESVCIDRVNYRPKSCYESIMSKSTVNVCDPATHSFVSTYNTCVGPDFNYFHSVTHKPCFTTPGENRDAACPPGFDHFSQNNFPPEIQSRISHINPNNSFQFTCCQHNHEH